MHESQLRKSTKQIQEGLVLEMNRQRDCLLHLQMVFSHRAML